MTTTITYTLGKFVWRELFTRDVAASKRFYSGLFGWTSEDRPMGPDWSYTLWRNGDKQIAGMMNLADLPGEGEHVPPHWAVYVSVEDVDATVAKAVAEGGTLLGDCHDIPGVGRFAVLQDPQGAHFNVFRSLTGDPEDGMPVTHEFCWETLATTDAAKAIEFYQKIIGWSTEKMGDGQVFTRSAGGETVQLASIGPVPEGAPPHWMTFVAVESVSATVGKCRELGGKVLVDRTEIPDIGAFAILEDPSGAGISVFQSHCG